MQFWMKQEGMTFDHDFCYIRDKMSYLSVPSQFCAIKNYMLYVMCIDVDTFISNIEGQSTIHSADITFCSRCKMA